jgi:hypothetical protein
MVCSLNQGNRLEWPSDDWHPNDDDLSLKNPAFGFGPACARPSVASPPEHH